MVKPRILILSTAYLPLVGGSELAIAHLADQLTDYDFDVVTARHDASSPIMEQIGRVRVFRAGGRLARWTFLLPKNFLPIPMAITALRLMRNHQYVAMHAYQASQAAGAAALVKLMHPRLPFLLTLQEGKDLDRQSLLTRFFRSLIFRLVTGVTAISNYLAMYARRYTKAQVDVIPNGVDIQALRPPDATPRGHTMVSVSRLVVKNGIEPLIRAMPIVIAQVPDAKLVLAGDGELRPKLQSLVAQLHLQDSVEFVGTVTHDKLPLRLWHARVFVRPSITEGLGSAFLEAMAAGCVVVGSRVGGIADFLEHERTGLVCNPQDPADIAAQLVWALTDDALRDRVVTAASAMVAERYNWTTVARQMDAVYRRYTPHA